MKCDSSVYFIAKFMSPSARKVWICGVVKNEVLNFIFSQPPFLKLSTRSVDNQMRCFRARIIEHYYKSKTLKSVTGMIKKAAEKKINQKLIFILHIKPQSDRYNTHNCSG